MTPNGMACICIVPGRSSIVGRLSIWGCVRWVVRWTLSGIRVGWMSVWRNEGARRLSFPKVSIVQRVMCYIFILCSFRILILTPWSEKERERKVESSIPGNCFALNTWKTSDVMDCKKQTSLLLRVSLFSKDVSLLSDFKKIEAKTKLSFHLD
jgi:hypothetical protein